MRAVYLYSAMADLAYEYQDEELEKACETLWNNMVQKRMYITGGIGSSGLLERFTTDYDLPNDRNYSESCASIGLAMFGKRMGDMTRDAAYADIVEKALYNTVLAGIAMDGKSFFYVNPLEVWPDNCMERTSLEHVKPVRQKWFGVACCPPNIARTLASLGQYIYSQNQESLYLNLYVSNETEVVLKGKTYRIKVNSSFLTDGSVNILAEGEKGSEIQEGAGGNLALRIPGYVREFKIYRNKKQIENPVLQKGYLILENLGDREEITIEFQIKSHFVWANPQVRADEGKVALMRDALWSIAWRKQTTAVIFLPFMWIQRQSRRAI